MIAPQELRHHGLTWRLSILPHSQRLCRRDVAAHRPRRHPAGSTDRHLALVGLPTPHNLS
jgi:hypothetical protein